MTGLIMAAQLILGLSFLVLIHEFGHFIAARIFGIRVNKFYIFFNPKFSLVKLKKINGKIHYKFFSKNLPDTELVVDENGNPILDEKGNKKYKNIDISKLDDTDWRKHPDNTEYGLGWLPLGGYCQIAGMIDETQSIENLQSEPQSWEFRSKPAWQRLIVVLGGVVINLIVGVLLFAMILGVYEKKYLPNEAVKDGIYAHEMAREIGFMSGDKIIGVQGEAVERFQDAVSPEMFFGSIVTVERNRETLDVVLGEESYHLLKTGKNFISPSNFAFSVDTVLKGFTAEKIGIEKGDIILAINDSIDVRVWGSFEENIGKFANQEIDLTILREGDTLTKSLVLDSTGKIGIGINAAPYELQNYSFFQAFVYGWKDAMLMLKLNVKGLKKIVSGEENASESVSGPIGIAQIYGGKWIWAKFWYITGLLSLILAFMNILPIPGLDGGFVLFTLIEMIIGRKLPDKFMEYALTVGWVILIALMIFVFGNDIFKLFK
ncbi:MAG TPA: RIP metalloprotease RseP [Bacteroidales bacterium]|nr:RIP metalloprotease RseP [Bacteroidales bacterium]HOR81347.1 RIP metalloprotease RseP [Bacteroidales bacterium]HPJ90825.1 RIP metalloprotease RseP [Bacteroidales bacterium]HQB20191.1 RIP metalloprotease RseP [Bacteroidales bacterium]